MENERKTGFVDEEALMNIMAGGIGENEKQATPPTQKEAGNKKMRPAKLSEKEYEEEFFRIPKEVASKGKSVYLRPEFHQRFLRMLSVLGDDKLTIYAYLDNIVAHHFKEYEQLITDIFNKNNSPLF